MAELHHGIGSGLCEDAEVQEAVWQAIEELDAELKRTVHKNDYIHKAADREALDQLIKFFPRPKAESISEKDQYNAAAA